MDDDTLVLYVLMRTDLASMNPGKAMAQSNHAYGAFKNAIRSSIRRQPDYLKWMQQTTQDFGVTIVLGGNEGGIQDALDDIKRLKLPVVSGWVHDPTYPVVDSVEGEPSVVHLIPLNTCAFVFGTKAECMDACGWFDLHP